MIAADEKLSQLARAFDDFVRACAVANNIAQVDDKVISGSGCKTRFQSFEVAVNVA
jgi:hypothetical protein